MKVLHVIARMNVGGTARYLETLSHGLTAAGIQNVIATGHVQSGEIEDECVQSLPIRRVRHLGRAISPLNDLRAWRELRRIVRDFEPDVIHTHTFKAGIIGRLIRFGGQRVHTYHGHVLNDGSLTAWQAALTRLAEIYLAGKTDVLISVGERVAQELRHFGIGRKMEWVSISPGVETPLLPSRGEAIAQLGLTGDRVRVGWLGRMIGVKDPELAIEIARSIPELEFLMAGGGELLESIRKAAPPNVKVLGWVDRNELLAACDLVMSTSKSEGMPLAMIEAWLAGLPLIAPNVGSMREIVSKEADGFIVDRKIEEYVEGINKILNDPVNFEIKYRSAIAQEANKFSVANCIEKHINIYRKIQKSR